MSSREEMSYVNNSVCGLYRHSLLRSTGLLSNPFAFRCLAGMPAQADTDALGYSAGSIKERTTCNDPLIVLNHNPYDGSAVT